MTSLSQIKYWLGSDVSNTNDGEGAEGAKFLSYDVFLFCSVILGFFAIDHLYLRSTTTFIAKFIVNVFFFGLWYWWDMAHAIFNADTIKVYGLSIPGWGPAGIAAGVLSHEVPEKKHLHFLFYAISLIFGGFFGLDSFVVGDRQTGIIRLLCAISIIFAPIALAFWGYGLFQFFTNTSEVVNEHNEFFGSPKYSFASRMRTRFPLLGWLFSPLESIKIAINNVVGPALIEPITKTVDSAVGTVEHAVSTIDNTVQLGRNALSKSSEIIDKVGETLETVSQASTILPAASLYAAAQGSLGQKGGSVLPVPSSQNLNTHGFVLLAILAVLALSGFIVTWYRARNVQQPTATNASRDDIPPEPSNP